MLITWLNPGMYLDSLVVVGGDGAKALSGPLSPPRVWRVLNAVTAAVLFILAS